MATRHMTSDGIRLADWRQIESLAREYVELVTAQNSRRADATRRKILRSLSKLSSQYGDRPSILATKSEYVESPRLRGRMLERAYELALRRRDAKNATLIASSLAEYYVEERHNSDAGEIWLRRLDRALSRHFDKTESRVFKRLTKKLRTLKN